MRGAGNLLGSGWATFLGCVALALAVALAVDSASYIGETGAGAVGYVVRAIGTPLLAALTLQTLVSWLRGRDIWPVEWPLVILAAGMLAVVIAGAVAADHANDAQEAHDRLHPSPVFSQP